MGSINLTDTTSDPRMDVFQLPRNLEKTNPQNACARCETALIQLLKSNHNQRPQIIQTLGGIGGKTAVPQLLDLLHDSELRTEVIHALGKIGDPSAVAPLWDEFLHHPHKEIKITIIETLGFIGSVETLDNLIFTLQEPDARQFWDAGDDWDDSWSIHLKAIESLGKLGDPKAAAPVMEFLEEQDIEDLIVAGFNSLMQMGPVGSRYVREQLRGGSSIQRMHAAKALRYDLNASACRALQDALSDDEPAVLIEVLRALSFADAPQPLDKLAPLLSHPNSELRIQSLLTLEHLACASDLQPLKKTLCKLLRDPEASVRLQTCRSLKCMPIRGLDADLLPLLTDENEDVIAAALETLVQWNARDHRELLVKLLKDPAHPPRIRLTAANALGDISGISELNVLLHCLHDPEQEVRRGALAVLGNLAPWISRKILLQLIHAEIPASLVHYAGPAAGSAHPSPVAESSSRQDPSRRQDLSDVINTEFRGVSISGIELQTHALKLLGRLGGPEAAQTLIAILTSAAVPLQIVAAETLREMGAESAQVPLTSLLESGNPRLLQAAVNALGALRKLESIPMLLPLIEHESALIADSALKAIARIGSKNDIAPGLCAAVIPVILRALSSVHPETSATAVQALMVYADESAIPEIVEAALREDAENQKNLGLLLRRLAPANATVEILDLLNDPEKDDLLPACLQLLEAIHARA